jgi:hypothetical protein
MDVTLKITVYRRGWGLDIRVIVAQFQSETAVLMSLDILQRKVSNDDTISVDSSSDTLGKLLIGDEVFVSLELSLELTIDNIDVWRLINGMLSFAGIRVDTKLLELQR